MRPILVWLQESDVPMPALRAARQAGLDAVLVREPGASAEVILTAALRVREAGLAAIVSDRLDVALALHAPCQLRHDSLPWDLARRVAPHLPLGCAVHSDEEAARAAAAGVEYLVFGHVFDTASKPGLPGRGVTALAAVRRGTGLPVLAIGGIRPQTALQVAQGGAAGIVVRSAIARQSPGVDVERLLRPLQGIALTQEASRHMEEVLSCGSG